MTKRKRPTPIEITEQIMIIGRALLRAKLEATLPNRNQIMVRVPNVGVFNYYPTTGSFMQSGSILEEERGLVAFLKFIKSKSGHAIDIPEEPTDDGSSQQQAEGQPSFTISAPPTRDNGRLPPFVLELSNSTRDTDEEEEDQ